MDFFSKAPLFLLDAKDAPASALWLIIAMPLLGALICGLLGKTMGRANTYLVACGSVAASFLMSVIVFWCLADRDNVAYSAFSAQATPYAMSYDYGTWFSAGSFRVNFGLLVDHLSGAMLLIITGIGFLIHLYSTGYMSHDEGYWRFFAYLNLFVAMMLTLVLADSLVLLFVGWEGVGLCSYLLIGFWYDDSAKAYAGRKAFITNRIGDFGFLVGSFLTVLLVSAFMAQTTDDRMKARYQNGLDARGPLTFQGLEELSRGLVDDAGGRASGVRLTTEVAAGPLKGHTVGWVVTAIMLCFLLGAAGKSAQFPLYVWLPDAMAGPTPVSALIHAATMVTAGLYLFCRMSYLLVLSPTAMATVAVVGAITALVAALIAFAQDDLKKVLAYSTVSQLGIMFMGIGAGIFWAAFLHVVTHAFFKACLFLGAGSVMHGNADEGNIRKLGGLRKEMPVTSTTFAIATLAITGALPLSGFFSKDAILHALHTSALQDFPNVLHVVYYLGLATAGATAFYMTRLFILAFMGQRAADAKVPHAHESAWPMTLPLVFLATMAVLGAAWGVPFMNGPVAAGPKQTVFENFLSPVFQTANNLAERSQNLVTHHSEGLPWAGWLTAWCVALAGTALAFFIYAVRKQPLPSFMRPLQTFSRNKFYVDEVYARFPIGLIKVSSKALFRVVDRFFIDDVAVHGTAKFTLGLGSVLKLFQSGNAQTYAAFMALALGVAALVKVLEVLP